MNRSLVLLAFALFAPSAYAQTCPVGPDVLEPNDNCATAVALPGNFAAGLNVELSDPDFYSVTVGTGQILTATAFHSVVDGDIDLYLWDPAVVCDTAIAGEGLGVGELAAGWTSADDEFLTYTNTTGAPQDLILEARIWSSSPQTCNPNYDLEFVFTTPPDCTVPDTFEPNDDCAGATPIGNGSYPGLRVSDLDSDFFTFGLADGATVDVTCDHVALLGDIDLYLWDPTIACDSRVFGEGAAGGSLGLAFTGNDIETISYTNTTGAPLTLVLEARIWSGSTGLCSEYTLDIAGVTPGGPTSLGSPFCSANPNSTGLAGSIEAVGSAVAANNDVTVQAANLPPGQFGIFVTSTTTTAGSPVGAGVLCLGGQLGRYNLSGQILQVNAAGEFSLALNLTQTPLPSAFTSVMAGETRSWQAWHRDFTSGGASTSNFTNGVTVSFN